jgi:hypothetical protein
MTPQVTVLPIPAAPPTVPHLPLPVARVSAEAFRPAVLRARRVHPYGACVDVPTDDPGTRYYLTGDECSGFAIASDGELCGLFSLARGRGRALLASAAAHGAEWLTCFDGYLRGLYLAAGWVIRAEHAWNPALAPDGWPTELGTPSVLHMFLPAAVAAGVAGVAA